MKMQSKRDIEQIKRKKRDVMWRGTQRNTTADLNKILLTILSVYL
jgi:hypothetical protein